MRIQISSFIVFIGCLLLGCGGSSDSIKLGQDCRIPGTSCEGGTFCNIPKFNCGDSGGVGIGVCEMIPDSCEPVWDLVCACDNLTYRNECEANLVGLTVRSLGKCPEPEPEVEGNIGDACSEADGFKCSADSFCNFTDFSCGISGSIGRCTAFPGECGAEVAEVCGCDGATYSNVCQAYNAAVPISVNSACGG